MRVANLDVTVMAKRPVLPLTAAAQRTASRQPEQPNAAYEGSPALRACSKTIANHTYLSEAPFQPPKAYLRSFFRAAKSDLTAAIPVPQTQARSVREAVAKGPFSYWTLFAMQAPITLTRPHLAVEPKSLPKFLLATRRLAADSTTQRARYRLYARRSEPVAMLAIVPDEVLPASDVYEV